MMHVIFHIIGVPHSFMMSYPSTVKPRSRLPTLSPEVMLPESVMLSRRNLDRTLGVVDCNCYSIPFQVPYPDPEYEQ